MRPQGAPPAKSLQEDLEAARATSSKKPNLKRPPAPPPKRADINDDSEEMQPLSKRKPPPSEAPPQGAAKDLGKLRQGPRPPKPTAPPPSIGASKIELLDSKTSGKAGTRFRERERQVVSPSSRRTPFFPHHVRSSPLLTINQPTNPRAAPQAKEGGRSPPKLPPPGQPPPPKHDFDDASQGSRGDKPLSDSPEKRTLQRRRPAPGAHSPMYQGQAEAKGSAPGTPVGGARPGYEGGSSAPRRPGVGRGSPPLPISRPEAPYRAPPGAPPGKSPPRAPPPVTDARVSANVAAGLEVSRETTWALFITTKLMPPFARRALPPFAGLLRGDGGPSAPPSRWTAPGTLRGSGRGSSKARGARFPQPSKQAPASRV